MNSAGPNPMLCTPTILIRLYKGLWNGVTVIMKGSLHPASAAEGINVIEESIGFGYVSVDLGDHG